MRPYSLKALELLYLYEARVVTKQQVRNWADGIIMKYDYDDQVAELSMASDRTPETTFRQLIEDLVDEADTVSAMRNAMGHMYEHLLNHPDDAVHITRVLEAFWISEDYSVPNDIEFIIAIDDEFALAKENIFGDRKSAIKSLITHLKPFHRLA